MEKRNKDQDKCIRTVKDTIGRNNYRTYLVETDMQTLQSDTIYSVRVYGEFYDFIFDDNHLICAFYMSDSPFWIMHLVAFEKIKGKWASVNSTGFPDARDISSLFDPLEMKILDTRRVRIKENGIIKIIEFDYEKKEVLRYPER